MAYPPAVALVPKLRRLHRAATNPVPARRRLRIYQGLSPPAGKNGSGLGAFWKSYEAYQGQESSGSKGGKPLGASERWDKVTAGVVELIRFAITTKSFGDTGKRRSTVRPVS
jgi:hypothetical protein